MNRANTSARAITLDRASLGQVMNHTDEDPATGIEQFGDFPAEQIGGAVLYAETEGALCLPKDVEMIVLVLRRSADAVVISLRESDAVRASQNLADRSDAGLSNERQVSGWIAETSSLIPADAHTFDGLCKTLDAVCEQATRLLPSLDALLDGEQRLLDEIAEPLTVLTYNLRARLACFRSSVEAITAGDPDHTREVWPTLITTLEAGESSEDWDGDRQIAYQVDPVGRPHLARQLLAARTDLVTAGCLTPADLPDPDRGFGAYLG